MTYPKPQAPAWRPSQDEPLFTAGLLLGAGQVDPVTADTIRRYLRQVTAARGGVLHLACAWNALHFGFDLDLDAYDSALLDPEYFHAVLATDRGGRPAVPVGAFVRIERGTRWVWGEAVGKFGAAADCEADGWIPAARSGDRTAAAGPGGTWSREETVVLDTGAFGKLSTTDSKEAARLRRTGLLDARGHISGTAVYAEPEHVVLDDAAYYQHHLLTHARPLLVLGPLAGLLDDPHDTGLLAQALAASFRTVADLLASTAGIRLWGPYAVADTATAVLPDSVADEVVHATGLTRTSTPRYIAVWPLLCAAEAAGTVQYTEGPTALAALMAANLAVAEGAGGIGARVDTRIDDLWEQGGVWRSQLPPLPWYLEGADPLAPLGIGHREATGTLPEPPGERLPPSGSEQASGQQEPVSPSPDEVMLPPQDEAACEPVPVIEHLDDSLAVYTCVLMRRHIDQGGLPLPAAVSDLSPAGEFLLELHHDGDLGTATVLCELKAAQGATAGATWPMSFYPGIKLTVTVPRGGHRLYANTTLLPEPLYLDDQGPFLWDCDTAVLRRFLGIAPSRPQPQAPPPPAQSRGYAPAVEGLRSLLVSGLRRHGAPGMFDARSLQGHQLSAALFGPGPVPPPLMWTVIHTCEDMAEQGLLGRDRIEGQPDLFTWWPADQMPTLRGQQSLCVRQPLRNHVKAHYVPPDRRKLPPGQRASDHARAAYTQWRHDMLGPEADATLPDGYTFVHGHRRGTQQPPAWHDNLT